MVFDSLEEDVKQADQVCGSGLVFWMELNTGERKQLVRKNWLSFRLLLKSPVRLGEGGDLNRGLVL